MKKLKNNKKGFTLIELLAVIVILAILVMIAIPAVTRYLDTARKGTFADNAQSAINTVRMDYTAKSRVGDQTYNKEDINNLLEKKLNKSPFSNDYSDNIAVTVTVDAQNNVTYHVCLDDGAYILDQDEKNATSDHVTKSSTNAKCEAVTSTISPSGE